MKRVSGILIVLLTTLGLTFGTVGTAAAVTQSSAASQFSAAGIGWTSSGGCTDPGNSTCTSFEGIRQATIDGAITLKNASGCSLTITGGTETGHAGGQYSHSTGYKLDFSRTACLTTWVHNTYTYSGTRTDGTPLYTAASGNVYADEGNHWDVLYYSCGC
ncbi:hypothetical protein ASC77_16575 [Nocardioides sp. Root1257]|uniref:hypothetical protein n=1 Tax=unclassified Nocardioides TaxID=2615069 RepID=UPI0007015E16|nr:MULTISPECIES: hypothetical protein [unclassified Nocardioides]KQW48008.1 hypothetical protein ASC77_16575 [Nocardioides sp. Root1257]KRC45260.1 hypothetical protein ASE24_17525 [Nocardioides sp. Root224]